MECIRIHASLEDVPRDEARAQADDRAYERSPDSSRIVCVTEPRDAGLVVVWGFQHAHLVTNIAKTKLGYLHKLSDMQLQYSATHFDESMRERYGFLPPNLVIVMPNKWRQRWRGRKFRRNLDILLLGMKNYRKFYLFDSDKISKRLPWEMLCRRGIPFFRVEPRFLEDDSELKRLRERCEKAGITDYGIYVEWLPFNGHFDVAHDLPVRAVMTGDIA